MSVAPVGQLRRGLAIVGEIVMRLRQAQQRQRAVGVARAQPVERAFGARQRGRQRVGGNAVRADVSSPRVIDGLDDSMTSDGPLTSLTVARKRRQRRE